MKSLSQIFGYLSVCQNHVNQLLKATYNDSNNQKQVKMRSMVVLILAIITFLAESAFALPRRCSNTIPTTSSPSSTSTSTSTSSSTTSGNTVEETSSAILQVVEKCKEPDTVAITFDDGPYTFTKDIIKQFDDVGGKITLFVNGLNWDCIFNHAQVLKSAYDNHHQIGSHTWAHADLATLAESDVTLQMNKLSDALQKIIGAVPTYMRPPYGSYSAATQTHLQNMGFKVLAMWDIDSGDSMGKTPEQQQQVYNSASTDVSHNILQHETSASTATVMVPFIIKWAKERNLKMVTLGECLGDPEKNWYTNETSAVDINSSFTCTL